MTKITLVFIFSLIMASQVQANVDCLRFMGKKAKLNWSKRCSVIIEDNSVASVESIDGCFGEYTLNNRRFIVFNSDLKSFNGVSKSESIITNGLLGSHATESEEEIYLYKKSASPELLKRYLHILKFNRASQELSVEKHEGRLRLHKTHDLILSCS